jgi:two-component system, NtrC family, sensor kinase
MSQSNTKIRRLSSRRILAGMRIRKKLIVLHTAFSLSLGVVLLIAIRPAMSKVIFGAEYDQSEQLLALMLDTHGPVDLGVSQELEQAHVFIGVDAARQITDSVAYQARLDPDVSVPVPSDGFAGGVVRWIPETDSFLLVRSRANRARETIQLVYILMIVTLIAGYTLVAAALEVFVLPEHVYRPISEILSADQAVRDGDRDAELIPEEVIPVDELGAIMRSRNHSILALRTKEQDLARALDRLERTAADLHKKNHLLETARKNLEGADRLASLGMMSAGIAHELNTPLAVVKGLVDKLDAEKKLSITEIALLARVVTRLEKLSDGLLDFARVRPPMSIEADVSELVKEACLLVELDRKGQLQDGDITIQNEIERGVILSCDPDRLVQVFVNLIRNAVDALIGSKQSEGLVRLLADIEKREGVLWVVVRVEDNGPGIDSVLIDRLFEPFVSTRLDAHGTGLGLAVANGIVREHGGVLLATNRSLSDRICGALFEVVLPIGLQEHSA